MKLTFTQFAAAAILATISTGGLASPVAWNGSFALYDAILGVIDGSNDVTGHIDTAAGTWSVASTTPFMGILWSASDDPLYGLGLVVAWRYAVVLKQAERPKLLRGREALNSQIHRAILLGASINFDFVIPSLTLNPIKSGNQIPGQARNDDLLKCPVQLDERLRKH